MNILVTGGSGFIGNKLVEFLCKEKHTVVNFSMVAPEHEIQGSIFVKGDVCNLGALLQTVRDYKIARIVHNAAISNPKLCVDNPYRMFSINVIGTINALQTAHLFDVDQFVYISSGAVYGNMMENQVFEYDATRGNSMYGASKVASEEIVRNYGLSSISLRLGFVYGPGRTIDCPIKNLLEQVISTGQINWDKGKDQVMDFVFIDDVVFAIYKAIVTDIHGHEDINIGGGDLVKFTKIVEKTKNLFPNAIINIGSGSFGYDNLGKMDLGKARKVLGWNPKVSIDRGIELYTNWLLSRKS